MQRKIQMPPQKQSSSLKTSFYELHWRTGYTELPSLTRRIYQEWLLLVIEFWNERNEDRVHERNEGEFLYQIPFYLIFCWLRCTLRKIDLPSHAISTGWPLRWLFMFLYNTDLLPFFFSLKFGHRNGI